AYRRAAALRLDLDAPGLSWPCQTSTRFARAGLRVTEIPANEPARIGGKGKMMPLRTGGHINQLNLRGVIALRPGKGGTRADLKRQDAFSTSNRKPTSPENAMPNRDRVMSASAATNSGHRGPFKLLQRCKVCGSGDLTDVINIAPQFLSPTFTRNNAEEGELAKIRVPLTMTLCDRAKNPP